VGWDFKGNDLINKYDNLRQKIINFTFNSFKKMGYSNFKKIRQVKAKFGTNFKSVGIFANADITPIEPSEWLTISLNRAYTSPPTNEKSKSERIVSPILLEVLELHKENIAFFSGEEVNINAEDDLAGPCDFFFALTPPSLLLEAPIISIAEAKDEDLDWGLAQCSAQLYAAHLFNLQEGRDIPVLYGCATDGVEWQFFKFENNTFYVEPRPMTDLPQILGTWHWIIQFFIDNYEVRN
jgi:hypothetical protein